MAADLTSIITINHSRHTCLVQTGGGRTFMSTPHAVGMELLAGGGEGEEVPRGRTFSWQDHLIRHGVAIGTRGPRTATLSIVPPRQRTVRRDPRGDDRGSTATVTIPAMLIAILMQGGRYVNGLLYLADITRQGQMSVGSPTPLLLAWPFGNVYEGSGRICWGGVRSDGIRGLADLEDLFFSSGFNTDLVSTHGRTGVRWQDGATWPTPPADAFRISIPMAITSLLREG